MIQVRRIAHATLETPQLDRMAEYYSEVFGLSVVGRERDRVFLATKQGQQAIVLELGAAPRCTRIAFQCEPGLDLGDVSKRLSQDGIRAEQRSDTSPGVSRLVAFDDPKGTAIDLFAETTMLPPDDRQSTISPLKLGHLAFHVRDIQTITDFYVRVLGFRVSDWRSDFFVFLRCGPDHHTVNFNAHGDVQKLHHIAFELKDWPEILKACDFLGKHGYHLIWGPGRHIIGHNIFIYHRNPDGQVIELYTELDQMKDEALGYFEPRPWHQDFPQRPKVWPADTLGSYWGGRAPPGFAE
jgi:catechol-2,3-dioxygenase